MELWRWVIWVFSTHTARFLLNDCDDLIFFATFADDGNNKTRKYNP